MKTSHKAQSSKRPNPANEVWVAQAIQVSANPNGNPIERAFAKAVQS